MLRRMLVSLGSLLFIASLGAQTFPNACVDCHTKRKEGDMRLTVQMAPWTKAVPPKLLARFPKSLALKGKHPPVTGKDIPGNCLKCHSGASKTIPPFPPLMHALHLAGADNVFVKTFAGDCRHCHKFDAATAAMKVPSAAEK